MTMEWASHEGFLDIRSELDIRHFVQLAGWRNVHIDLSLNCSLCTTYGRAAWKMESIPTRQDLLRYTNSNRCIYFGILLKKKSPATAVRLVVLAVPLQQGT